MSTVAILLVSTLAGLKSSESEKQNWHMSIAVDSNKNIVVITAKGMKCWSSIGKTATQTKFFNFWPKSQFISHIGQIYSFKYLVLTSSRISCN